MKTMYLLYDVPTYDTKDEINYNKCDLQGYATKNVNFERCRKDAKLAMIVIIT